VDREAIRRNTNGTRGWRQNDPVHTGRDALEDKKLRAELMKMLAEEHFLKTHQYLSKKDQEELAARWLESGEKGEKDGI